MQGIFYFTDYAKQYEFFVPQGTPPAIGSVVEFKNIFLPGSAIIKYRVIDVKQYVAGNAAGPCHAGYYVLIAEEK